MNLPLRSNAYDDVTDFEICLFHKNTKTWILERETYFFLEIKHSLIAHEGLVIEKKSFVAKALRF